MIPHPVAECKRDFGKEDHGFIAASTDFRYGRSQYPGSVRRSRAGAGRSAGRVLDGSARYPVTLAAGALVSHTVYSLATTVWFSRNAPRP